MLFALELHRKKSPSRFGLQPSFFRRSRKPEVGGSLMFQFLIAGFLLATPLAVMAQRSTVQVTRAEWGANRNWMDVTRRVQAIETMK